MTNQEKRVRYQLMSDSEVLENIKKYFNIRELVSPIVYKVFKERAWRFFSIRALKMLLITRELVDAPMTINNWMWGGKFTQRGLRSNLSRIVKDMLKRGKLYISAHVLGEAFDYDVAGMTAIEVRKLLVLNADLFPFKIRLENKKDGIPINWVHSDTIFEEKNPKVYLFDV